MSPRPGLPCFTPEEAASRRRIRRYAVPRRTIERAAERRAAGDWRGACAAAGVDVAVDLAQVAEHCGQEVAAALEDDLRHLVPDLLHWHLPRVLGGWTTLDTGRTVVLARYRPVAAGERPRTTPYLHVTTPAMREGPQRVTLRFRTVASEKAAGVFGPSAEDWRYARHLWDARRTAELRERCGGTDRSPFFHPDGRPRGAEELPAADPGPGDAAARSEWITLLHQRGEVRAALTAAGIEADLTPLEAPAWYQADPESFLGGLALQHTRLEPEMRRLADEGVGDSFLIAGDWRMNILLTPAATGLRLRAVGRKDAEGVPFLPEALWRRLPDLDLLRAGGIEPAHLHPLVREALFPALEVPEGIAGPPGPAAPAPVRVRCRGEWHEVGFRAGGLLHMPHSDEEQQRERALRAFGGAVAGCFAVQQTWASGSGRLPKALRAQMRDLFLRAQHGDTDGVLELLDAGVDPRVRDGAGRTLLHVLHLLDHEPLLPRLLEERLDLEARDRRDRTPLFTAVNDGGSRALVEAFLAAGARIDVVDEYDLSLAQLIRRYKRRDLSFLRDRVRERHPGIGADWWDEMMDESERYDDQDDDRYDDDQYDDEGQDR
ncbi:ankyrin repeat domain-containing protein [Streptomyces sp. TRM S81-3]|uniref:Ankyrin repeat domain-containing protein n=1 Tax=Streptomyces griseicoloratus TaxID=2752516 RepID=A0A926KXS3_9ACTN|nr:ankyrin repeat domain-containing protein [Streptomyces griseicoloratus]MBD0418160.1 ankyrin repeat domain-containing protein [Streptomyces griseicoloratus]